MLGQCRASIGTVLEGLWRAGDFDVVPLHEHQCRVGAARGLTTCRAVAICHDRHFAISLERDVTAEALSGKFGHWDSLDFHR